MGDKLREFEKNTDSSSSGQYNDNKGISSMPRNQRANNSVGYNGLAWWENTSNRKQRCGKENSVGHFVEVWHVRDGIVDCCDGSDEDLTKLYENDKKLALNSTLNVKNQDKKDECLTQFVGMKFEGDDGIIHYSIDFGQIVTLEDGEEFRIKMELMENYTFLVFVRMVLMKFFLMLSTHSYQKMKQIIRIKRQLRTKYLL
ncbi:MAG: hypothetical protein EZS28_016026 [Streblomastix strix]|uniref:Uncharacterized protein n=1 Tax=Streblomastix strix TaxID=222440 RepID=A0A5J4W1N1_9EUKA|nr:MAG: hypothetical protein EZS28_016026 [Streblomastix strix]